MTVCTAEWLARQALEEHIVDCRHHVVIDDYDYDEIERYFQRRVAACEGSTWQEVAAEVGRLGRWEFEDYTREPSAALILATVPVTLLLAHRPRHPPARRTVSLTISLRQ